ncbi:MAG: NADH-quinone oxidoreductase subunit H [Planctomycetes bacterium]|nr:NADH-quinone oxidoreductase subunit H [Planctomycetota bacterium]
MAMGVLTFLLAAVGTLVLGLLLRWVDRKVTARVQWRVGPPWYQPFVDILKLTGKEKLMPASARGTGFLLAPVVGLAAVSVSTAILWHAVLWPQTAFMGDLIVLIYLLMLPALMTMLGAASSGNPHAAIGASREMKLLLSYELPMVLAILVAIVRTAGTNGTLTFRLGDLMAVQQATAPAVAGISGVLALLVAILCMQAKLGQVPFDMAEAECEIQAGVYVEYSGPSLAMILMTRAMLGALMPLLLVAVFWDGLYTGAWWGYLTFAGKYLLLVVLVTLIRNTNPRLRIDQVMRFFWYRLTPVAVAALILAIVGAAKGITWL